MLVPEGLWFLGECLEEASRTEDNNSTTPSINGYTLFRASTWCAQCYSRMLREGVQIITVASTLNVNSCIVFISGGTVDDKLSMQKQLVIEAWYMAISTTKTKWMMSNWALKVV